MALTDACGISVYSMATSCIMFSLVCLHAGTWVASPFATERTAFFFGVGVGKKEKSFFPAPHQRKKAVWLRETRPSPDPPSTAMMTLCRAALYLHISNLSIQIVKRSRIRKFGYLRILYIRT